MSVNEIQQADSDLEAAINKARLESRTANTIAERRRALNKLLVLLRQRSPARGSHVDVQC